MSLLNGLKDAMINPLYDAASEADLDLEMDFEFALESAVDPQIELSESDIAAILDDDNPDNIVADMSSNDESVNKIQKDFSDEDIDLEAMIGELLANESNSDDGMPSEEPEDISDVKSNEGCGKSACENDDADDDDFDDDEDDEDEEYTTLDSLLTSIFND